MSEIERYSGGMSDIINRVYKTQMVAGHLRGKVDECFAVALRAHEIGVPLMQALGGDLYVVDGKVGMSAELMRSQVIKAGHSITIDATAEAATAKGRRCDTDDEAAITWTIADAETAGLTRMRNGKAGSWQHYPRQMLTARATSELCRMLFPDVLRGVSYTHEELDSIRADAIVEPVEAVAVPDGWPSLEAHDAWREECRAVTAAKVTEEPGLGDLISTAWAEAGYAWPLEAGKADLWTQVLRRHGIDAPAVIRDAT